jgi:hypothetical protein
MYKYSRQAAEINKPQWPAASMPVPTSGKHAGRTVLVEHLNAKSVRVGHFFGPRNALIAAVRTVARRWLGDLDRFLMVYGSKHVAH